MSSTEPRLRVPVNRIRERLRSYSPRTAGDQAVERAGVAMILRRGERDTEMLLIRRAERLDDPWSGHVALPGGRRHSGDPNIVATAVRETKEEVGIDLATGGRLLGQLDELVAVARDRPLGLVITPVVYELEQPVRLILEAREIESALWAPIGALRDHSAVATYRRTVLGSEADFPALRFRDYTIWGLTHSIVDGFLRLF